MAFGSDFQSTTNVSSQEQKQLKSLSEIATKLYQNETITFTFEIFFMVIVNYFENITMLCESVNSNLRTVDVLSENKILPL